MDILEGVGKGAYYKREVTVKLKSPHPSLASPRPTCIVYFYPAHEGLLRLTLTLAY